MVREAAVRIAVNTGDRAAHPFQKGQGEFPADAVAGIENDVHFFGEPYIVEKIVGIGQGDVPGLRLSRTTCVSVRLHDFPQFLYLRAVNGVIADTDLEAVEFRRIVAARDHDAAARVAVANGEVKHRRRAKTDVDRVDSRGIEAPDQVALIIGGAQTAITPHRHDLYFILQRIGADGAAEINNEVFIQILIDNAPDVVFAKNMGIHKLLLQRYCGVEYASCEANIVLTDCTGPVNEQRLPERRLTKQLQDVRRLGKNRVCPGAKKIFFLKTAREHAGCRRPGVVAGGNVDRVVADHDGSAGLSAQPGQSLRNLLGVRLDARHILAADDHAAVRVNVRKNRPHGPGAVARNDSRTDAALVKRGKQAPGLCKQLAFPRRSDFDVFQDAERFCLKALRVISAEPASRFVDEFQNERLAKRSGIDAVAGDQLPDHAAHPFEIDVQLGKGSVKIENDRIDPVMVQRQIAHLMNAFPLCSWATALC